MDHNKNIRTEIAKGENPYLEAISGDVVDPRALGDELIPRFGWGCPSTEAIELIVANSPGGVFEPFAGTGYWSAMLRARGVDVWACDVGSEFRYTTLQSNQVFDFSKNQFTSVVDIDAYGYMKVICWNINPNPSLLMVWPDDYDRRKTDYKILRDYPGDTVFIVMNEFCGSDELKWLVRNSEKPDDIPWIVSSVLPMPERFGLSRDHMYILKRDPDFVKPDDEPPTIQVEPYIYIYITTTTSKSKT